MNGQLVKQMVSETPQLFMVTSLPVNQEAMIDDLSEKYKKDNKLLHIIRGSEAEVKRLSELLEREQQRQSVSPLSRKVDMSVMQLQSMADPTGSYLIKFFFSIAFIFMLIAAVNAILDSDSKKDTLLYAKFLADVNSR